VISLGKLSSFALISTELPLIFSAGSGPFGQEAESEALKVLLLLPALRLRVEKLFSEKLEKIFNFFDTINENLNYL